MVKKKFCEYCHERPVGFYKHKYCEECSKKLRMPKYLYRIFLEHDLDKLERGEHLSICKRCGKRERMPGNGYCRICRREQGRIQIAKRKGLNHWTPYKRNSSNLCCNCHQNEKAGNSVFCRDCRNSYYRIYHITGQSPKTLKPVTNPEAYYTDESTNLTCPICKAEYCLPSLPLGKHCQKKILHYRKSTTWQDILKLQGIRIPTLEKISPELAKIQSTCCRCKINPIMKNYIYCEACYKAIQKETVITSS